MLSNLSLQTNLGLNYFIRKIITLGYLRQFGNSIKGNCGKPEFYFDRKHDKKLKNSHINGLSGVKTGLIISLEIQ